MAIVAALLGAAVVGGVIAAQPGSGACCAGTHPYVTLYDRPLSAVDAVLASGDGQAFGALAQDPLLRRPEVITVDGEYAYRAQRPVWAYLAWAASLGQPDHSGLALAVLTALSCGLAAAFAGLLLADRGVSAWWALLVVPAGIESLFEFTPELLAFALACAGLLLWSRDRRALSVVVFCLAVLTRESMLVAVAGLAVWELRTPLSSLADRGRRVACLAVPFAVYAAWAVFLRIRLDAWPSDRSGSRLGLPGAGYLLALGRTSTPTANLGWAALALLLCGTAVVLARRDPCTWIAVGFGLFAILLGPNVWLEPASYNRVLLPLYAFAGIAIAGGLRTSTRVENRVRVSSSTRSAVRRCRVPVRGSDRCGSPGSSRRARECPRPPRFRRRRHLRARGRRSSRPT